MSRAAKLRPKRGEIATTKIRSLEETEEWIRTSYAHALTRAEVSARKHARRLGVDKGTTASWKAGLTTGNVAQIIRDPELAGHFLQCLRVEERQDRKRRRRR